MREPTRKLLINSGTARTATDVEKEWEEWDSNLFKKWFGELPKGAVYLSGARGIVGMTQTALAKKLGTSQPYISRLEQGKKQISRSMAMKLANIFSTEYIFFLK